MVVSFAVILNIGSLQGITPNALCRLPEMLGSDSFEKGASVLSLPEEAAYQTKNRDSAPHRR